MKKIILIPALVGVAVASGVVSARFLTAGSVTPAKSGTPGSPEVSGQAAPAVPWSPAGTNPTPNGEAKRALSAAPISTPPAQSQAKRLLNSLKDRTASSRPPSTATTGVEATGSVGVPSGSGAAPSGEAGEGTLSATGGVAGASGGAGAVSNGGGGVSPDATAPGADTVPPGTQSGEEIVLSVPAGAVVPAAFVDNTPRTPQQQKVLDQILTEFETNVSTSDPGVTETENWNTARQIADQRYLTLFGYQAYNQYHLQAAKEAVKEKKTVEPPLPRTP